jgi:hypothetical protein
MPMGLSLLYALKEAPLVDWRSATRFGLGWGPILILSLFFIISPASFNGFVKMKFIPFLGNTIPQVSFVSALILIGFSLWMQDRKIKPFLMAILFSLIPFFTASYAGMKVGLSSEIWYPNNIFCFSVISIILVHSIYQMYWQRVYIDELTAIPNRRALDEKLLSLSGEYAIAMIDIDHFKKFNDTYGHDEGDNVLRLVAKTIESVLGG